MGLTELVFAKQRIESIQRIAQRRELTEAEKDEYETLVMQTRQARR
jgi:hypothetical protein